VTFSLNTNSRALLVAALRLKPIRFIVGLRGETMPAAEPDDAPEGGQRQSTTAAHWREPPPAPVIARSRHYMWFVVGTVCIGAFMGQLDASIAQLVLPTLERLFHARLSLVSWVALAYLLALAGTLPIFGRLADMFGRKLLYTGGFVVFIAGSALAGFAPTLIFLIGARVFQAIGAGLLQANSVAIITAAAGPARRGRAIGVQGAAQAIGLSTGPALGGLLIQSLGWRWVFWINFGLFFLMPFALERGRGASPLVAGLLLTVIPVALGVVAPLSGALSDRIGARPLTVAGMLLAAGALVGLALEAHHVTLLPLLLALAAFGVGQGLFTAPNNSAIMGAAPSERLGVAGGVLNLTRSLGTSLGVAVASAVLSWRLAVWAGAPESTAQAPPGVLLNGIHDTLLLFAALAVVAAAVSLVRSRE
jgi:MFS family permease